MSNIPEELTRPRPERGWSAYELAKTRYRPSPPVPHGPAKPDACPADLGKGVQRMRIDPVPVLQRVTMRFSVPIQREPLDRWPSLTEEQQQILMEQLKHMT